MSYVIEKDCRYGSNRKEIAIDLPRFAADLAKELGGEVLPAGDYPGERQKIKVGADELWLGADNHKKRVSASLHAPDVPWNDRNMYDKAARTDDATVNPDGRPIAVLARDIRKRVIDANQPAMAAQRAYADKRVEDRGNVELQVAALKASHPALNVRISDDKLSANISGGCSGHYIDAQIDGAGRVSIRRIGTVSAKQFDRIMAALSEE